MSYYEGTDPHWQAAAAQLTAAAAATNSAQLLQGVRDNMPCVLCKPGVHFVGPVNRHHLVDVLNPTMFTTQEQDGETFWVVRDQHGIPITYNAGRLTLGLTP